MMEIGAATTTRASNVNVTVALCLLCAVLEGFDIQAMGVAAPRLLPEFGLSPSQMGWVFSVSNIGLVIGAAFGGWLADRVGRKPVFIAAVATFGVFTLGVALASNFTMLFVLRFLAGARLRRRVAEHDGDGDGDQRTGQACADCGDHVLRDADWRWVLGGAHAGVAAGDGLACVVRGRWCVADAARAGVVVVHGGDAAAG